MLFRLISFTPEHEHIVVSLTDSGYIGSKIKGAGHVVLCLHLSSFNFVNAFWTLYKLIRKNQPDAIQTWMYHSDLIGGVLGRLAGVRKIIWNIRNTEIPQSRFSRTYVVLKICSLASRSLPHEIICNSNAGLESHSALGYERKRMLVIPNGYDASVWNPALYDRASLRRKYGLPQDAFIIGMIGRHDRLKGYDDFIKAAALLAEKRLDYTLFFGVGRGVNHDNPEFNKLISKYGKNAEFKLIDEQSDIAEIMATLDVFCLSSKAEGFPNVVAEAMLMKIPCVVTDVGDASVIVGNTGIIVPPCNQQALADAFLEMIEMSSQERLSRGVSARQRIIEHYDIQDVAQRYTAIYCTNEC